MIRIIRRSVSALRPTIKQILNSPPKTGTEIDVCGHIKTIRKFKKIGFIDIGDGSTHGNLSIVCKDPEVVGEFKVGQSINIVGEVVESKGTQDFEILFGKATNHKLQLIGDVSQTYPIQKKEMTLQYLRNYPELRHRTSTLASVLRLRSQLELSLLTFFTNKDFIKVTPPMITGADTEGAGEQFKLESLNPKTAVVNGKEVDIPFFGKNAFLTVSTQLHLEALASSLNRVWTLTPCFRAEESNTNRHLSEFWMLEAEVSYVQEISQLTNFCEEMIKYVTKQLVENSDDILNSRFSEESRNLIKQRWDMVLSKDWPSITYTDAIDIIKTQKDSNTKWGDSISTEHEKWLAGEVFESPVFITDYPQNQKPFYMPESNTNAPKPTVACFDLIFPVMGELIGGSLREHDYTKLVNEMTRRNMKIDDMEWFLSTRLNGSVPHGGFGMGFERLISYLTGIDNLKDIVAFPRTPGSCDC